MRFVGALIFLPETADSDITCDETSATAAGRLVQPLEFFSRAAYLAAGQISRRAMTLRKAETTAHNSAKASAAPANSRVIAVNECGPAQGLNNLNPAAALPTIAP